MPVDISRSQFMLVPLHSQRTTRQSEGLCVKRVTVIQFDAVIVREKETIAGEHATAICGALLHSILGRSLYETSERLNGGLGSSGFLGKCRQGCHCSSQNNR